MGLNGAGKSTLMRLLVGLLRPDAGQVNLWGRPAWQAPAVVRSRIGYVSSSHLYAELTITDHVQWAARLHGCRRRVASRRADDVIDRLALRRWASKPARTLSTGNRQRLAIATALIHDPDLMIFDDRPPGSTRPESSTYERSSANGSPPGPASWSPAITSTRWPGWLRSST